MRYPFLEKFVTYDYLLYSCPPIFWKIIKINRKGMSKSIKVV